MSETVDRLKELLFESEAKELSELSQRLDSVHQSLGRTDSDLRQLVVTERLNRGEMLARIDAMFERAGSRERFESSVAEVISHALRRAEISEHDLLADAVAPVVVRTVKMEIHNSKDELVEALYPMTGRMVKAYIASAMKDLANDINRRLEANPVMLRLRSLTTGKSMAELAMADTQRLNVEELYLIRRGTGELVARWPEQPGSADGGRDHVMSGILTAINEFSSQVLQDEGSSLRQIDLGERQLYLRASPAYLLAAKCSGTAPQPVEAVLDEAFLAAMERLQSLPVDASGSKGRQPAALLPDLSNELGERIAEKHDELAGSSRGVSPLKMLAWIIGLPLAGYAAWSAYGSYRTERTREIAAQVIAATPDLSGYPVRLGVERRGNSVTLSGLSPSKDIKLDVGNRLRNALPGVTIDDELSVLPNPLDEVEPKIAGVRQTVKDLEPEVTRVKKNLEGLDPKLTRVREDMAGLESKIAGFEAELAASQTRQSLDRAAKRLQQVGADLPRLAALAGKSGLDQVAGAAVATVGKSLDAIRLLQGTRVPASPADAGAFEAAIMQEAETLAATTDGLGTQASAASASPALAGSTRPETAAEAAEALSVEADRLATAVIASIEVAALRNSLPTHEPTQREKLEAWARANAVFFGNGTDYRNPDRTRTALAGLAQLMGGNELVVRVVGYTDDKGDQDSNTSLSKRRADTVAEDLAKLGVAPERVVALGRIDTIGISPAAGELSPNRRVEFEIGFEGEGVQ